MRKEFNLAVVTKGFFDGVFLFSSKWRGPLREIGNLTFPV